MAEINSYEDFLHEAVNSNDNIIVMTAENRAAFRGLPAKIGQRFIDTGICEQTLVGMAAGFALRGRTPLVHALACFLTLRAFEFIRTDAGYPNLPLKLVGSFPGFLSTANGPTHQAIEDVALMAGIPNVNVFCPADLQDLLICLPEIINSPNPYYIRYNDIPAAVEHSIEFAPGKAELINDGDDLTIITYGFMLGESVKAAELLRQSGISAAVINLRTVKPIDREMILRFANKTKMLVLIEDHFEDTGLMSVISRLLVREKLMIPVLPVALKDKWFKPAMLDEILEFEGFTANKIAEKIKAFLNK
ncbi:MAG: transketolase family protein [Bacteroidota bacterium]